MVMWKHLPLLCLLPALGCGSPETPERTAVPDTDRRAFAPIERGGPIAFPTMDDQVSHDTLSIQTTFDLGDGSFVMVASHVDAQDNDERQMSGDGLRLYRFKPGKQGAVEMMAVSSPGHDSWTLFPTFFEDPSGKGKWIIAANTGDRDSWGQKIYRLSDAGFEDLGFLDVTLPERQDDGMLRLRNVAQHLRCSLEADALRLSFACDSIFLYNDLKGGVDQVLRATSVEYRMGPNGRLELWVNGDRRIDPLAS